MEFRLVIVCLLVGFGWIVESKSVNCPCSTADLCKPVDKQYKKQLIVFGDAQNANWKKWNWTEITNVILISTTNISDLYCFAHSKNIYVTILVGTNATKFDQLMNVTYRQEVISSWVDTFTKYNLDGINMDIEGPAITASDVNGISALAQDAYTTVKKINSNHVVTFDVYYSPYLAGCISFLCYNYTAIASGCDYMIAMDYDATLDLAVANSNSPLDLITQAYDQYINELKIPADRFVMAVPWYGYDYSCSRFYNDSGDEVCVIVNDQRGQKNYADIAAMFSQNIGGLKWWPKAQTPYFTIKEDNVFHQFQFDNVESLTYKYKLAVELGLHGIGMFEAEGLDYISTDKGIQQQTAAMWNTLTEYVQKLKPK